MEEKNMEWCNLFPKDKIPTFQQITEYVNHPAFLELDSKLRELYGIEPAIEYSRCSMQPGWNLKYKKSGKALCTVYPAVGYYLVLLAIGNNEMTEAELFMASCTGYVRDVFQRTEVSNGAKWLMLEIRELQAVEDLIGLVMIRKRPKK